MAFKLTKEESKKWDGLVDSLREEREELFGAINQFNSAVADAKDALQAYVDGYNEALNAAKEFVNEIGGNWRGEFDDRSETWQEGDKGQEVSEIIDALENFEVEEFELADIDGQDVPEQDIIDELEGLKPQE